MRAPKLTNLEFQIMEVLSAKGECSIREIVDTLPGMRRPAYTTIQTTVYRIEGKNIVRRVKKVGYFHVFIPAISREAVQRRLLDDNLAFFGGRGQPVMAHLIETGKLSLDDVKEAERLLQSQSKEGQS
jgi:BlaI family penicillinase repressor